MGDDIRNKKPPELCQIMITEMRHVCHELQELKKQRWKILLWLIPTLLISVDMMIRYNGG